MQPIPSALGEGATNSKSPRWVPLDALGFSDSPVWARRIALATTGFVIFGVALRLIRYLLCFPLWGDEAYLAVNFPHRSYLQMLEPLDFGQVCPILFLWIELTCVRLLGMSEWSLRLFPLLCGLAAVFLFWHVAAKVVKGSALLTAVALFAVSFYPIRYAAEVKPYSSDLLVALGLLALTIKWLENPRETRWLWWLAACIPGALAISYPAVFVAGSVSATVFVVLCRQGRWSDWIPFAVYNLLLAGTFLGLLALVTITQYDSSVVSAGTLDYWGKRFPPLGQPLQLIVWLVANNTGRFFGYPIGDENGASAATFICFAIGAWILWKRGDRRLAVLFLCPFALNLVAAAMRRYPYGGSGRIAQHLAPAICILFGLGMAALLGRFRSLAARQHGIVAANVALGLFGLGMLGGDLVRPCKHDYDRQVRDLSRTIWVDKARDAEVVCLSDHAHEDFASAILANTGAARAQYLCYQRILKEKAQTSWPKSGMVSAERPLRCVLFRVPGMKNEQLGINHWLAQMQERYRWTGYEKHELPCYYRRWKDSNIVRFEIYEFGVKRDLAPDSLSRAPQVSLDPTGILPR